MYLLGSSFARLPIAKGFRSVRGLRLSATTRFQTHFPKYNNLTGSDIISSGNPTGAKANNDNKNAEENANTDDITSYFNKLPEKLILEGYGMSQTTAENQLDTQRFYTILTESGFTSKQSNLIIQLLLALLQEEFFYNYNTTFLRKMELENQSYLFNAAESELRYSIYTSREVALNELNLQLMKLDRELNLTRDDLNELIINLLKKDSRVDFNDYKSENTLLHRDINIRLEGCNNMVGTRIIGQIKPEVEGLRWQITRSGLFALLFLVFFVMSGVSITRRIAAEHEKQSEVILHTRKPEHIEEEEVRSG
ncbi:HHR112Wp [Eremothecium sinecaudum]|uniref:HHR112Wp n=1 Tax=Eremothecium sinecaudum TaxID=45286 RepID=A0A0X8HWP7_9SACH|nr:HHR112Wp [Eremothecium sinecaudum]AMD22881.1 HHR112Wp [Eremothecium sinecaudum]